MKLRFCMLYQLCFSNIILSPYMSFSMSFVSPSIIISIFPWSRCGYFLFFVGAMLKFPKNFRYISSSIWKLFCILFPDIIISFWSFSESIEFSWGSNLFSSSQSFIVSWILFICSVPL